MIATRTRLKTFRLLTCPLRQQRLLRRLTKPHKLLPQLRYKDLWLNVSFHDAVCRIIAFWKKAMPDDGSQHK